MNKRLKKIVSAAMVCSSIIAFAGCSGDDDTTNQQQDSSNNTTSDTQNTGDNQDKVISTKEEYVNYLDQQSKKYLSDLKIDTEYDFDKVTEDAINLNEDYIIEIKDSYSDEVERLTMLKNDLKNNVKSDDKEVQDLNNKVIASIDKNIQEIEGTQTTLIEKAKDLAGKTKADFISAMKEVQKLPKDARAEYDKLINDAKNTLGIQ